MTPAVFVKRYNDPARCVAAHAHLRWLQQLDSGVRLPHLYPGTATHLVLERLDGQAPQPADLPELATVLGQLHGAAYARELHTARLDRPFHSHDGVTITDFYTGRRHTLAQAGIGIFAGLNQKHSWARWKPTCRTSAMSSSKWYRERVGSPLL